jgi:hypothetical protein
MCVYVNHYNVRGSVGKIDVVKTQHEGSVEFARMYIDRYIC